MARVAKNHNPEMLKWVRLDLGLSLEQAAKFMRIDPQRLEKFENGEVRPTRKQLFDFANKYGTSIISFYLNSPPSNGVIEKMAYFRMPNRDISSSELALTKLFVKDILVRQAILKDLLEDLDEAIPSNLSQLISIDNSISDAATKITDKFDLDQIIADPKKRKENRSLFQKIRSQCEAKGIFVLMAGYHEMRNTHLGDHVFRGVSLADDVAPIIVINSKESGRAHSFTLLHELAHICIGSIGVSRNPSDIDVGANEMEVERFCNDVASEILLPAVEIDELGRYTDTEEAEVAIRKIADMWVVSEFLVAYRLYRVNKISGSCFRSLAARYRKRWITHEEERRRSRTDSSGGPSVYTVKRAYIGRPIVDLVRRGVASGELRYFDAAKLLGVKVGGVEKMIAA